MQNGEQNEQPHHCSRRKTEPRVQKKVVEDPRPHPQAHGEDDVSHAVEGDGGEVAGLHRRRCQRRLNGGDEDEAIVQALRPESEKDLELVQFPSFFACREKHQGDNEVHQERHRKGDLPQRRLRHGQHLRRSPVYEQRDVQKSGQHEIEHADSVAPKSEGRPTTEVPELHLYLRSVTPAEHPVVHYQVVCIQIHDPEQGDSPSGDANV
mmetsp:Transcript_815/g.3302  ORF Transcript_815/g.3302 Transcript_815/m.3302 type:complete len:208 (+) Transcript_815:245-868(+)